MTLNPDSLRAALNRIDNHPEGHQGWSKEEIAKGHIGILLEAARLYAASQSAVEAEPLAWTTRDLKDGRMVFATHQKAQDWVRLHFPDEGATITPLYPAQRPSLTEAPGVSELENLLTEGQIKYMANRFLGWKLPEDFHPDGGISFKRTFNDHLPQPMKYNPSGTNLFDSGQALEMVRYMVEGMLTEAPGVADIKALRRVMQGSSLDWLPEDVFYNEGWNACLDHLISQGHLKSAQGDGAKP
jgi:hypothetical protein